MSIFAMTERDEATAAAFASPKAGQRFSEMYSYWMYVVRVGDDGRIWTLEGNPPVTFPDGGKLRVYETAEDYRKRFAYGSIPGYWVSFADDTQDVHGWFDAALVQLLAAAEEGEGGQ